jgi:hypothetical protein
MCSALFRLFRSGTNRRYVICLGRVAQVAHPGSEPLR